MVFIFFVRVAEGVSLLARFVTANSASCRGRAHRVHDEDRFVPLLMLEYAMRTALRYALKV
jgi:hypothetical protein